MALLPDLKSEVIDLTFVEALLVYRAKLVVDYVIFLRKQAILLRSRGILEQRKLGTIQSIALRGLGTSQALNQLAAKNAHSRERSGGRTSPLG